ncbi:MAG: hypothetical protein WC450_00455 [Candidatus Omnitrophota bacterium]|jgi:hypothetical protein
MTELKKSADSQEELQILSRDSQYDLACAVSLNSETAGEHNFNYFSTTKKYIQDILLPLPLISRLTARGSRCERVKQTAPFVVGVSRETDQENIKYSWKLYKALGLARVYFSAYQRGEGDSVLPREHARSRFWARDGGPDPGEAKGRGPDSLTSGFRQRDQCLKESRGVCRVLDTGKDKKGKQSGLYSGNVFFAGEQ